MRLISLHADAVRTLERLRIPFDDLTPDGLWNSPFHLIGLTQAQADVLTAWNLAVDDVTPDTMQSAPAPAATAASPAPRIRVADAEVAVPITEEREIVEEAVEAAEAESENGTAGSGGHPQSIYVDAAQDERRDPTRLRVSIGGRYREAAVREGKIVLDGQRYDSPAQATRSVAPAKGDWVFWEYFDSMAGKWRMLDGDWQPGATS
jgi:hypothetical protein